MKDIETIEDIKLMVDSFYYKVNKNEKLSVVFNDHAKIDWEHHLPRMYNFWSSVLLYKGDYKGSPFQKHISLPIDSTHFDQWLTLFNKNLNENFSGPITEDARKVALSIGETFQAKLGLLN